MTIILGTERIQVVFTKESERPHLNVKGAGWGFGGGGKEAT